MRRWNPFFLRRDEANGSILGATVMDFDRRFSGSLETVLPITFEEIAARQDSGRSMVSLWSVVSLKFGKNH